MGIITKLVYIDNEKKKSLTWDITTGTNQVLLYSSKVLHWLDVKIKKYRELNIKGSDSKKLTHKDTPLWYQYMENKGVVCTKIKGLMKRILLK